MDFLENLFDFGDRKNRGGRHGGHDDHDDDHRDYDRYDDHHPRTDNRHPENGKIVGGIRCTKCSTPLADSFKFCPDCGAAVSRISKCGSCGGELVANAKFCAACGAKAG